MSPHMRFWGIDLWIINVEGHPGLELYVAGDMDKKQVTALALKYLEERKNVIVTESSLKWKKGKMLTRMDVNE